MPTAAKLVAAICLALVGYLAAEGAKSFLMAGQKSGQISVVALLVGIVAGWRVVGGARRGTLRGAVASGLTGAAVTGIVTVFFAAVAEMFSLSFRQRYDNPLEAVVATFSISFDFMQYLLNPQVAGTLIVGGVLTGLATEWARRHWR